jgi:hypothetical protein
MMNMSEDGLMWTQTQKKILRMQLFRLWAQMIQAQERLLDRYESSLIYRLSRLLLL